MMDASDLVPPMAHARDLLDDQMELLPAGGMSLINPLVYCNVETLGEGAYRRWIHCCNAARDMDQAAVRIGRYARGSYLDGNGPYAVLTRDTLVEEQAAPAMFDVHATWRSITERLLQAVDVERPCLLACCAGDRTWGHWLLDMLPKIVLAEQLRPQRFTYAVPAGMVPRPGQAPVRFDAAILESLAAYGIGPSRLLRVQPGTIYRFQNLYDVVDIVRDGMHPGALAAMRDTIDVPPGPRRPVTAVMRPGTGHRRITNMDDVGSVLRRHGAAAIDPACASFADQVRAFRESDIIVGDLGSNLAACIYARPETGVVTLAPSGWYDDFFVNIFQRLQYYVADVRGISMPSENEGIAHAPHCVNPADLEQALRAVAAARATRPGAPIVCGRMVARAPGPVIWQTVFGERGDAAAYQRGEFAAPERHGTWSIGASCGIVVSPFATPSTDLWLEIKGVGFVARPYLVARPLRVLVNGILLGEFDIDVLTHLHVAVPAAVLRGRTGLELIFQHPVCLSPQAMGMSNDTRALGLMFESLALRAA